jgi:hypothetical protein
MAQFKKGDIVGSYYNAGMRYEVLYQKGGVTGVKLVKECGCPAEHQFQYEAITENLYLAPEAGA